MFFKLSLFTASMLITLASAQSPFVCCNSLVPSSNKAASAIAGLVGLSLTSVTGNVGLICVSNPGLNPCVAGTAPLSCDTPDPAWGSLIAINCGPAPF
ncbi:hypothetical protein B0H19DRAFT_1262197 [Mycena capillaripes]|nr:hypothetical protein B0H19DRAFT_1262197 [Mycena capillaripes]